MNSIQILIVEDDENLREALIDTLMLANYSCLEAENAEVALDILKKETDINLVITDVQMNGMNGLFLLEKIKENYNIPVLLMTAYAKIDDAVHAMRTGAVNYLAKPFSPEVLLNQVNKYAKPLNNSFDELIYADDKTKQLLDLTSKVAKTDTSVLITGNSGTGKELLAKYIHNNSPRKNEPFIIINCASLPTNILDSTLFGYEQGAFTGAMEKSIGKFEQANNGTILLDEISEASLPIQAKLLRVLENKQIERLGGNKLISLNIRIIAITNKNLSQYVKEGKFREDLYYRLNVFPIKLPSLSERNKDILPIANYLIKKYYKNDLHPEFTLKAKKKLINSQWHGNIRELENVIQRALIMIGDKTLIDEDDLIIDDIDFGIDSSIDIEDNKLIGKNKLKHQEYQIILDTLEKYAGKRTIVAEKLNISPRTLRYKMAQMKELGINIPF